MNDVSGRAVAGDLLDRDTFICDDFVPHSADTQRGQLLLTSDDHPISEPPPTVRSLLLLLLLLQSEIADSPRLKADHVRDAAMNAASVGTPSIALNR